MKILSYSHNPSGLFQIRIRQANAIKDQSNSNLAQFKIKKITVSFDKHLRYPVSMTGGWAHIPIPDLSSLLHFEITEEERLKQGSLIVYNFTNILLLHNNPVLNLVHNEVQQITLSLLPQVDEEDLRPSALQKFELDCEIAFISSLSIDASGISLSEEEGYFETHPLMLQIKEFQLTGLDTFFEENMIVLGKEADYFLVIGDDLTDPNNTGTV